MTGLLMAAGSLTGQQSPAFMCLRAINPYVGTALHEWAKAPDSHALTPRQLAPNVSCPMGVLGGESCHAHSAYGLGVAFARDLVECRTTSFA